MPRKGGRGRGRNYSSNPSVSVSSTSSRRGASNTSSLGKGSPVLSKQPGPGRTTQNSKGHRGSRQTSHRRTPQPKPTNGKGRRGRKDASALQDPTFYKADDGVIYRPGDYAYVDSQQPELPFHICVINNFKLARKDSVIAEVKWYYRVTELPEAVYLLLMADRKRGDNSSVFAHPKLKDRELFMAYNRDTHPASLFRGKCYIKEFHELKDSLAEYLDKDDSFFYSYGYKPESRRLTLMNEESFVPGSQQAVLPECLCPGGSPDPSAPVYRAEYNTPPESLTPREELVWDPQLSDDELLMYLRAARSIALHAGVCMTGMLADGYLAASSDETTQHAFDVLHKNNSNTENALQDLIKHPIVSRLVGKKNWSKEDAVLFSKGMRQFGKNFFKIRAELLPRKEITELVEYYYYWKKTSPGLASRSTRRQRKTAHIRMSRSLFKPREVTPEKEFIDWSSCDEDDGDSGEDGEKSKTKSYYACRHCYTVIAPNWHHAGPDKGILCGECRIHFKNYGFMKSLTIKREPPEFMYKDFHESIAQHEESATPPGTGASSFQNTPNKKRKTRNSNGTRGSARPGLRSAKPSYTVKTEYDEDEEAEASESSESSEYDAHIPVSKPKPLQARRSILDNLDENIAKDENEPPAAKRQKRDQMEGSLSEEEDSLDSTNGDRGSQKSPNGDHSPGQTSTSSAGDEEGGSLCSSQTSPDHVPLPQQFTRVVKDRDSSCARTDLVYMYVPPEEKKMSTKVASAFATAGSSAHGGHPSELPTPTANVKVPIITPHAPQLPMGPMGPPAFIGFPQAPYLAAGTPASGGHPSQGGPSGIHPEMVKRSNSMEGASNREREQQQQQQLLHQQWLASMQQSQLSAAHLHPSHPHHTPVTGYPGGAPHHEQTQQTASQQPMVFTFPTQEEMSIRQRLSAPAQLPITPEQLALLQQGLIHPAMLGQVENLQAVMNANRLPEEQQHADASTPQFIVPGQIPANANMEQLLMVLPQQQQQAVYAAAAGLSPVDNPLVEFQRQFDIVMQQVQKDPSLMQHPQVQHLLQQRQLIAHQAQTLQMAGQDPHHINLVLQQTLIRMQQEQLLIQQAHQQQEAQKQYMLVRSQGHVEGASNRSRPGVIVGNK